MGTPLFAVPILKSLYQNGYPISVVYTQPPQKSRRGQKINKSPVQGISETLNIEFRSPQTLKDNKEEYQFLKELNADLDTVRADLAQRPTLSAYHAACRREELLQHSSS